MERAQAVDRRSPRRLSRARLVAVALYLAVILPGLIAFNVGLVPDVLVFVLLGAAVVAGQARLFVRDWGVFLLVIVLWQQTSTLARWANFPLHLHELITADRTLMWPFLHGQLPQLWLQQHLYHRGTWQWYDLLSVGVYALHFPQPLIVGFAIWLRDRALFRRFAAAFLMLAGIAFVIYVIYPAIPPWMAGRHAYRVIPRLTKIFSDFNYYVLTKGLGHQYSYVLHVNYNLTAAMPSLHAAFPVLSALYLRKTFGKWGLLMLAYGAVVWFAVVYLGEHWVIDVLAGLVCAGCAYLIVEGVAAYVSARRVAAPDQANVPPVEARAAAHAE